MNILMVLSSHAQSSRKGTKTGFCLEELAAPYCVFKDAGYLLSFASPLGGQPLLDPGNFVRDTRTKLTERFNADLEARAKLAKAVRLDTVHASSFEAVLYLGGPGVLWDLVDNASSIELIEAMLKAKKPVAAIAHAPAALLNVRAPDGAFMLHDKKVTGFSNSEEKAAGFADALPFLVEDRLLQRGANYSKVGSGQRYVITDGLIVTGQNPASAEATAYALLASLTQKRSPTRATAATAIATTRTETETVDARHVLGKSIAVFAKRTKRFA